MKRQVPTCLIVTLWSAALTLGADLADQGARQNALQQCNVTWHEPGKRSTDSMPIGNGDIGLNVWVEGGGDLVFYISKTDAWCENARLLKLGRVRVRLSPNPFRQGQLFKQELRLASGEIVIKAGEKQRSMTLRVWVDANHPVVEVDVEGPSPFEIEADLEIWRTAQRELGDQEMVSAYGLKGSPTSVLVAPDSLLEDGPDRIVWCHRNERSIWEENLRLQGLVDLTRTLRDPLLLRTFGGVLRGDGLERAGPTSCKSVRPVRHCRIAVYALTSQTDTTEAWLRQLHDLTERINRMSVEERLAAHRRWWSDFWDRSWIYVSGDVEAQQVTQGYALQRFINACAGRGAQPIKFNGSIFTMDTVVGGQPFDADYRNWGGPYWFQNTRLPYWSMLAAGDFDLMQPLFRIYSETLPLARARTQRYYQHAGAFWPETMYFWGSYTSENYGWDRQGKPEGLPDNRYIRYHWEGGLELVMMLLDYYAATDDETFLGNTLLPIAADVVTFYDQHYPRDERGRLRISPAQALETYWDSVNPAPEVAGLKSVISRLLSLPSNLTTVQQRDQWVRILKELPPLPLRQVSGQSVLGFAEEPGPKHNAENPELYAVFPFRLYTIGRPDLDLARRTFEHRVHRSTGGWQQDAIQAALLGLSTAAEMVVTNFSQKNPGCRFPAFWGPNFDWTPDQDHGCVPMIALQRMLEYSDNEKIYLLPAWPKRWDVAFKLHAPHRTTVEAEFRHGHLERWEVSPTDRRKDVVLQSVSGSP